jgi:DNA-directed RNA polymerase specialized sigma24 family protein
VSTITLNAGHKPVGHGHQGTAGQPLGVLLQRACAADWTAWNELMSRFGRLLLHTARSIGLNDSDAADVAQLTWLRLWEHGHQIRDPECLPAWLTATARREGLRIALSGKRYVLCADPTAEHGESAGTAVTDVYPIDGDYEPVLEQALAQLPAGYQRLIRLLMSDSCPSYTEVAKKLDLPIGSIGPMRMRALQMLRLTTQPPGSESQPATRRDGARLDKSAGRTAGSRYSLDLNRTRSAP